MSSPVERQAVEEAARTHARALWGLCYRMTGDAADADDLVQDTLTRALERPRAHADAPLERWLTTVALNLSRDRLRQRKRTAYPCPWLPSPVETEGPDAAPVLELLPHEKTPAGRYELLESVSFAFLIALEVLTPQQRSVLILRDVFDYSVAEAAQLLELSEANVKTTHLRARKAMAAYDSNRQPPTPARVEQCQATLFELLRCLHENDAAGAKALLARDAVALNDGGGEFFAANKPVVGAEKIVLFNRRLYERGPRPVDIQIRVMNGLPALVFLFDSPAPKIAPVVVSCVLLNEAGLVEGFHSVLASRKLKAVRAALAGG
jgi:RNA polymerase sigma-70 factor (ECF subfamily)